MTAGELSPLPKSSLRPLRHIRSVESSGSIVSVCGLVHVCKERFNGDSNTGCAGPLPPTLLVHAEHDQP